MGLRRLPHPGLLGEMDSGYRILVVRTGLLPVNSNRTLLTMIENGRRTNMPAVESPLLRSRQD